MPYKLRKAPKRDLYWVIAQDGKHMSKEPIPKERAEAQIRALYASERQQKGGAGNHHTLHGAGPLPQLSILQQIAKAAYSTSPPQDIGPFKLRSSTPTLKFYVLTEPSDQRHIDTVIVGIRGTNTSDKQDLYADAKLALGQLEETPRWKKDLDDFNAFMSRLPDRQSVDVYGVGHSLGGAVLDAFLKKGLIKQGVSYNPAISSGDAQKDIPNRRIYQDGDPLLAIMGRSAKNVEIRPKKQKKESIWGKVANAASYFIPYVGLVKKGMDTLDAHALDNFTGGYTSKVQDKPDVIDRLEDIAVVRRSKGYYVYANDPETRAAKRWGPFTKKVAEFEKKLLHQRQRHHLQPIAEEEGEEGGMRGGAHSRQEQEWINNLNEVLSHRGGRFIVPALRNRQPFHTFTLNYALNNRNQYIVEAEGGRDARHIIRRNPYPPPRRTPTEPAEEIDDPLGVVEHLGLGRMRGGRMEVASAQPPPPPPPHNRRSCELPYYNPHTLRRGQAEVEFREGDDMEEVLAELPDDAPMIQPIQARLPQRNRSSVRNLGMGKSAAYLRQAKAKAKAYGLDPKKLKVATDGKHKLSYDGILFGATRYGDHLLWSAEEKAGRVPKGTAEKKRKSYRARAMKIKGEWKDNKVSPNNLAIHILW